MSTTPKWSGWAIRAAFLALVIAALALTSAAQTTSSATTKKTAKKSATTTAAPAATSGTAMGQKIFIDPVTRKPIQPTQEDIQALENAGRKASAPTTQPRAFYNPRGGVAVKLDDSFMSYAVAGKDADGKLRTNCVEGIETSQTVVKAGKVVAPKTTKKEALDEE